MAPDEIEYYDPVELRSMEEPFDAVCRALIRGTDWDEIILDLRRREFSSARAERFIAEVEADLEMIGGSEEEYAAVQLKQNAQLAIGSVALISAIAMLPFAEPASWSPPTTESTA